MPLQETALLHAASMTVNSLLQEPQQMGACVWPSLICGALLIVFQLVDVDQRVDHVLISMRWV